jgi:LPXTG-motif cell wall-anchored protein
VYGNGTAMGVAGGSLAATGISTGSTLLAMIAGVMIVSGLVLTLMRHRHRRGQRP